MKNTITDGTRKPLLSIPVEPAEKALIEAVAKARGTTVASLIRMLAIDEARRLGLTA